MSYDPNVPNPPPRDTGGSNNTLYFIVGGLVVLAGIFVFIYTNNDVGVTATDMSTQAPAVQQAPAEPAAPAPAPAPAPSTGGTTNTQ